MKTTIKILILISILGVGVYAMAKPEYQTMEAQNTTVFYGGALLKENMTVVKFQDGKTNCYTVITKVNDKPINTAISCVK